MIPIDKFLCEQGTEERVPSISLGLNRKTSIAGCAAAVEKVNPGAAFEGMTQTWIIPGRVAKAVRNTAMGKHLHCRAEVTQRDSFVSSLLRFLSCRANPVLGSFPKPSGPSFPSSYSPGSLGLTLGHFPPGSQRKEGSPSMQRSFRMKTPLAIKPLQHSDGFYQTPPAGTADCAGKGG